MKKKRKEEEERTEFIINYRTSFWVQQLNIWSTLCPETEISDMIVIMRSNISSNGKNQYY